MIDGKKAYPSTSNNIKVTRENPYLKKTDSYTYDITFPLDVMANRIIFGAVNRIDVRKKVQKYKVCRLYAANKCVISAQGGLSVAGGCRCLTKELDMIAC